MATVFEQEKNAAGAGLVVGLRPDRAVSRSYRGRTATKVARGVIGGSAPRAVIRATVIELPGSWRPLA